MQLQFVFPQVAASGYQNFALVASKLRSSVAVKDVVVLAATYLRYADKHDTATIREVVAKVVAKRNPPLLPEDIEVAVLQLRSMIDSGKLNSPAA
ncbi:hypothetical protein F6X40_11310 [Paraburkholderia sp. UCT31]|uniref:hypothetical protein n=1 Tax=Paraburkholderia sp. UCT31 TaxID=2615209 RepID=UPI0016564051|nr:hypothetical protein [Paraburkholderia sp. UCT31]MBC8737392.1 hypothetical protein [Paraburkholderia sp. UCT31]